MGGALTAVSPDFTRASLGVPADELLGPAQPLGRLRPLRELAFEPAYTDELEQPLVLSLSQMLWDRGEPNGYAHRMTDNPLPNTPPHEVLMNVAFGDHQVSNFHGRHRGPDDRRPDPHAGRLRRPLAELRAGVGTSRRCIDPYHRTTRRSARPSSTGTAARSGTTRTRLTRPSARHGRRRRSRTCRTAAATTRMVCRGRQPAEQQMVSDFLRPNAQSQITRYLQRRPLLRLQLHRP